ncbi:hypothetical protein [Parvibium lacunae]|uniref:hypothetical protein n=1 Tax=Parvibium lacunae TaxID=1888893 RepID=UPI0011C0788B|nr:hypothetical protein [Parvibium lacunae]
MLIAIVLGALIAQLSPQLEFSQGFAKKWGASGGLVGFAIALISEELLFVALCLALGILAPIIMFLGEGLGSLDFSGGEVSSDQKRHKRLAISAVIGLIVGIFFIVYFRKH